MRKATSMERSSLPVRREDSTDARRRGPRSRDWVGALLETLRTISTAQSYEELLATGLERLLAILGPGHLGCAVVRDDCSADDRTKSERSVVVARHLPVSPEIAISSLTDSELSLTQAAFCDDLPRLFLTSDQVEHELQLLTESCSADLFMVLRSLKPTSMLCVPLGVDKPECGWMLLASTQDGRLLGQSDVRPVSDFAVLLALAVQRIRLHQIVAVPEHRGEARHPQTEVVSVLSHQMRTPLASIKACATALLLQGSMYDDITRQELLQTIEEEADRMVHLIGDILESSTIETGLLNIEPEPVLLSQLAHGVVRQAGKLAPNHRFLISFPSRFPIVHADPGHIEQVLRNLIDNAIKYSPDGGLVSLRGRYNDVECIISVADQGVGIAPEHLNRLFERFYRVRGDQQEPVAGTGLGLPIARAIVEAHGGRIWAESTPGNGAIFYMTLPRRGGQELDRESTG